MASADNSQTDASPIRATPSKKSHPSSRNDCVYQPDLPFDFPGEGVGMVTSLVRQIIKQPRLMRPERPLLISEKLRLRHPLLPPGCRVAIVGVIGNRRRRNYEG